MGKSNNNAEFNEIEHELHDVEDELQDFEERQVNVTRTLQLIVYPAMVAFIILSAYGFYLVQSLTTDVHHLTQTIADMNTTVNTNMTTMTGTITSMNDQMGSLVSSTDKMAANVIGMNSSTQDMAGNIQQMNASTQNMAVSTYNIQRDMWSMNKNISGPMKMLNKFNPFGSDKTQPYVVPPPGFGATPYYNNYYAWPQTTTVTTTTQPTQVVQPAQPETVPATPAPVQTQPANNGSSMELPAESATAKDGHSAIEDPLRLPQVLASQ